MTCGPIGRTRIGPIPLDHRFQFERFFNFAGSQRKQEPAGSIAGSFGECNNVSPKVIAIAVAIAVALMQILMQLQLQVQLQLLMQLLMQVELELQLLPVQYSWSWGSP